MPNTPEHPRTRASENHALQGTTHTTHPTHAAQNSPKHIFN